MMPSFNRPKPNPDPFAAEKNWWTHRFDMYTSRCVDCECRLWGIVSQWPCGTEPERETVHYQTASEMADLMFDMPPKETP